MTRIRCIAVVITAGLALVVTSCGDGRNTGGAESFGVPSAPPSAAAPALPPQSPEQDELYGPRVELPGGLLLKQLGKVAQYQRSGVDDVNQWEVRVVVDKIEVDPKCSGYAPKPQRGHRIVASLRVETSERYADAQGIAPNGGAWSTVGADGVSEAPGFTVCDTNTMIPNQLRPAAKYRGQVAIDSANGKGQLVLLNNYVWNYG